MKNIDNSNIVFTNPNDIEEYIREEYIRICTERDLIAEEIRKRQAQWFNEHTITTRDSNTGEITIDCDEINLEELIINDD